MLSCGGSNNKVKLWDISIIPFSLVFDYNGMNNLISCSLDSNSYFAIGSSSNKVEYYLPDGSTNPSWFENKDECVSIDFDPTDQYLVVACNGGGNNKGYLIDSATGNSVT